MYKIYDFRDRINRLIKNTDVGIYIRAFYIVGSIGMRSYVKGESDFDFVIVSQEGKEHLDYTVFFRALTDALFPIKTDGVALFTNDNHIDTQTEYYMQLWSDNTCMTKKQSLSPYECYCVKYHSVVILEDESLVYNINKHILHEYFDTCLHSYWIKTYKECVKNNHVLTQEHYEWFVLGLGRVFMFQKMNELLSKENIAKQLKRFFPQEAIFIDDILQCRIKGKKQYKICTNEDVLRIMNCLLLELGLSL